MSRVWSQAEVESAVAVYFEMYEQYLRGNKFNKAEHNRRLQLKLANRTKRSVEDKHQNISAALVDSGLPYLPGYVPLKNYQLLVLDVVQQAIDQRPDLLKRIAGQVIAPAVEPAVRDILSIVVDAPKSEGHRVYPRRIQEWRRRRSAVDYLERESKNRDLGLAGERLVLDFEIERLERAGRTRDAARIEHISLKNDAAGFDILSFEENGKERFIEVKTTSYAIGTPFYLSRNEVNTSSMLRTQFFLYRLFEFRDTPRMYLVHGALEDRCMLDPTHFQARIK